MLEESEDMRDAAVFPTFEIRIRVYGESVIEHLNWDSGEKHQKNVGMLHREARTADQATDWAKKWGKRLGLKMCILSCRKVDAIADMEKRVVLHDLQVPAVPTPYRSALAMDEMIWAKRNKRRAAMMKDKDGD